MFRRNTALFLTFAICVTMVHSNKTTTKGKHNTTIDKHSEHSSTTEKHNTSFEQHMEPTTKPAPYYLVVGISGVTNGGKSTLARHIQNHFELGKVTLLSLDDYFIKDTSRLEYLEPLKRYNYDQMKSVDWDLFYQDAQEIIYGYERKHTKWDHVCQYIFILEGFLLFNEWRMRELCSLKYHFVLPYQVAKARRAQRRRTPDHNGTYFDQVVWPAHLNHSKDIQNLQRYERIKTLNGTLTLETLTDIVLTDIEEVCGWNDPEDILHPKFNE